MQRLNGPRWITFLYNHNPFYVISACLVLFGIQSGVSDGGLAMVDPWVLGSLLTGYTALLALTGFLIVRIGGVWDDARTIFMILLLLFFALSVSFDSLCISAPATAISMLGIGFVFACLVTEFLLRGLGIKFPTLFKIPYYLMLAISFFYPLTISARNAYFAEFDIRWLLVLFPVLCAITILSGLPAIRQNAKYVAKNGTTWCWPLFPYSVFTLLIIGLCGRVILLTMAFDPSPGVGSIFGSYFLVPIYLAVLIAIFEIGVTEKSPALKELPLFFAIFVLPLAVNWSDHIGQASFVNELTICIGSPVWIALMGLVGFYFVTWVRNVEASAGFYLNGSLFAACSLRTDGLVANGIEEISMWPCLLVGVLQVITSSRRTKSLRWFFAAVCFGAVVGKLSAQLGGQELAIAGAAHWMLLATLLIAFLFADRFALQLKVAGAGLIAILVAANWITLFASDANTMEMSLRVGQAICLTVVAVAIFAAFKDRLYLYASTIALACTVLILLTNVPMHVDDRYQNLAWFGSIGLACFAVGAMVSALKAGLASRFKLEFEVCFAELRHRFNTIEEVQIGEHDSK